ncbi:formate dehydrogenase accessory sulfurtransferase FdhD [Paenibacillus eucommiae]|uniref:Sulfur carrier protein FdhD n=1 Tax=Paenibacillus eucommiae TaxID=1355755 RepID=A0ABS4IUL0_9BACL|nr:formate dehydrogenase accessory sulfurtransferase FdhD [Paenibacillus eucommiae]MBP1990551.1 FdhD protein [Paenibacillus eucommiae]
MKWEGEEAEITAPWSVFKYDGQQLGASEEEIACEYPLTLKVDGEELATIVCTPSDLEDMVIGFLASEGVIRSAAQVESLAFDKERGFAAVKLRNKHELSEAMVSKRIIGSCCGMSRQFYFHNDARTAKTILTSLQISVNQCFALMRELQQQSDDFRRTGGVHNAALCTVDELIVSRTDIGRHNALDKIYGHCLRQRLSLRDKLLAFSGRVSSEVALKAAKIGVGLLLSKSAPTDLALRLAHDLGITIVGFIRGSQLNVYTHPKRITEWTDGTITTL